MDSRGSNIPIFIGILKRDLRRVRNQFNKMKPTDSIVVLKGEGSIFLEGGGIQKGVH